MLIRYYGIVSFCMGLSFNEVCGRFGGDFLVLLNRSK